MLCSILDLKVLRYINEIRDGKLISRTSKRPLFINNIPIRATIRVVMEAKVIVLWNFFRHNLSSSIPSGVLLHLNPVINSGCFFPNTPTPNNIIEDHRAVKAIIVCAII